MNKFDDFDACMQVYEEKARYCYVRTAIKPDLSSQLYNYIAEFSSMQKQHFRHDKLTRGICLNTCRELLDKAAAAGENYYVDEFKLDYAVRKLDCKYRVSHKLSRAFLPHFRLTSISLDLLTLQKIAKNTTTS